VWNVETSTNVALLAQNPKIVCNSGSSRIIKPDRPDVESRSTTLFAVSGPMRSHTRQRCPLPGPMSSHTRQRFSLFQVQCRVTLDSAVHYQVLCRVTLDSAFRCPRSYIKLHSTALSAVPGLMSSHTRQIFPLFQAQCRVTLDNAFRHFRSNVEPHSTLLSSVPSPMSSSDRHVILRCSLSFCNLVAAFRL